MEVRTEVLCGYICELEIENTKLRAQIDVERELRLNAENENESLRELIEDMRKLIQDLHANFKGVVFDNWSYSSEDFRVYEQCMRELGMDREK